MSAAEVSSRTAGEQMGSGVGVPVFQVQQRKDEMEGEAQRGGRRTRYQGSSARDFTTRQSTLVPATRIAPPTHSSNQLPTTSLGREWHDWESFEEDHRE